MQNHPDQGGDEEIMKTINLQYHEALKQCDGQKNDEGHIYNYKPDIEDELMQIIMQLQSFRGLDIALIGYWIWVSGDTKPIKDKLKDLSFSWHSKRKCWYYKPKSWKYNKSKRSDSSLSEIAQKYGYKGFNTASKEYMPTTV